LTTTYIVMRKYSLLLLLFILASCQESTEPVEQSTLEVSKSVINLNVMTPKDSSYVELSCGCRFTLSVEKFIGDTNVIHFSQRDASTGRHRVALDIWADTLANEGNYAASLAILSTGGKGTFRDTIHVAYARN
jgi:hypothetical protein